LEQSLAAQAIRQSLMLRSAVSGKKFKRCHEAPHRVE